MVLLEAVETQPLRKIKALIKSENISDDEKHGALLRAFAYERTDVIRFLLEEHCSVNTVIKTYALTTTPLHCAIKLRDLELVKEILQKNPSVVNKADSHGNSPLHLAFLHRYEEAVDLILMYIERKSRYANPKNENGLTHMHIACTRRNKNVINGFLKNKDNLKDAVSENSPYWAGYTALHFAVDFGSLDAFDVLAAFEHPNDDPFNDDNNRPWQLIEERLEDLLVMSYFLGNKNRHDVNESKPYFILACLRKNPNLLKKFTDYGVNVNYNIHSPSINACSNTALHFAVESGHVANVELLLQHCANVEVENDRSMTSLHLALYKDCSQKSEIVDLLYKAVENFDVNLEDRNGLGYFQIAVTRNDLQAVKKFLTKGVDVNKLIEPNSSGFSHFTALHFAVLYQHAKMARLLIRHGANVDSVGRENHRGTPLHVAFEIGHKDSIEVLLENGADATLIRADGRTAIHLLVLHFGKQLDDPKQSLLSSDKPAILMYVEQLTRLGMDVNARDEEGITALHLLELESKECAPCFRLLLELGADVNLKDNIGDLPLYLQYYREDRCNSTEYMMFYHHVQKLKTLGSYVHPENNDVCEKMFEDLKKVERINGKGFRNEEFDCRQQQRLDEVEKLKNIMITPFTSLYHFVKLDPKRAAIYVPNEVLEKILAREDFDKTYPSYGYLIRLRYKGNLNCSRAKDFDKRVASSGGDEDSSPSKRQRLG